MLKMNPGDIDKALLKISNRDQGVKMIIYNKSKLHIQLNNVKLLSDKFDKLYIKFLNKNLLYDYLSFEDYVNSLLSDSTELVSNIMFTRNDGPMIKVINPRNLVLEQGIVNIDIKASNINTYSNASFLTLELYNVKCCNDLFIDDINNGYDDDDDDDAFLCDDIMNAIKTKKMEMIEKLNKVIQNVEGKINEIRNAGTYDSLELIDMSLEGIECTR